LRRTLDATKETINVALADQRPWLNIEVTEVVLREEDGVIFALVTIVAHNIGRSPAINTMAGAEIVVGRHFLDQRHFEKFFDKETRWKGSEWLGASILPSGHFQYGIACHSDPVLGQIYEFDFSKMWLTVCVTYRSPNKDGPLQTGVVFELRPSIEPPHYVPLSRFPNPVFAKVSGSIFAGRTV
jgi:hypothetical protein